jgi:hypothetical protein
VRYNSNDLSSGDTPSIMDSTGLKASPYASDFAFSPSGSLYDADCGNSPGIYVYPTGQKKFSSKLAPSAFYTNSSIQAAGCALGIAIK